MGSAAMATDALLDDLHALFRWHVFGSGGRDVILLGHSFGASLVLSLVASRLSDVERNSAKGLILLGASLAGYGNIQDGGHPIFRLPVCILNCLQQMMTQEFIKGAYHPETDKLIKQRAEAFCNMNSMHVCKAFYRKSRWVTKAEASQIEAPVLLLHGAGDGLIPLEGAEALCASLRCVHRESVIVVESSAHQLFEEQPAKVACKIQEFLAQLGFQL